MDEETGIDAVSKDGAGASDDELSARRKGGAAGGSVADRAAQLAAEQAKLDADGAGSEPVIDEAEDGQFFVWEQGAKVSLGTLIKRGTPVEHAFVFGGKRVQGRGGLMGFDDDVLNVVRFVPGPVRIVPTRGDDGKVTKVVIENHVGVKTVVPVDSNEAMAMIGHVLEARGYVMKKKVA